MEFNMDEEQILQQVQDAMGKGDARQALQLVSGVVKSNPRNERAWLMLAVLVDDPDKKRECLTQVLVLNPDNEEARWRLNQLEPGEPEPQPVAEEKLAQAEPEPYLDLRDAFLAEDEETVEGIPAVPVVGGETVIENKPGVQEELRTCPMCRAEIPPDAKVCSRCGWEVPEEATTAEKAQQTYRRIIIAGLILLLLPILCVLILFVLSSMGFLG